MLALTSLVFFFFFFKAEAKAVAEDARRRAKTAEEMRIITVELSRQMAARETV